MFGSNPSYNNLSLRNGTAEEIPSAAVRSASAGSSATRDPSAPKLPRGSLQHPNSQSTTSAMSKIELSESLFNALKDKVIIVTGTIIAASDIDLGGASGIGKSMVEYFHSKGAKVVFGDLNDKNGKAVADKLGA
jgi:hypothetical protein